MPVLSRPLSRFRDLVMDELGLSGDAVTAIVAPEHVAETRDQIRPEAPLPSVVYARVGLDTIPSLSRPLSVEIEYSVRAEDFETAADLDDRLVARLEADGLVRDWVDIDDEWFDDLGTSGAHGVRRQVDLWLS